MNLKKRLWISEPDGVHNNYGLQIYDPDGCFPGKSDIPIKFEKLCFKYFSDKKFGMFFQGGHNCSEWRYFEFWCNKNLINEIIDISDKIAKELNMPLEIGD